MLERASVDKRVTLQQNQCVMNTMSLDVEATSLFRLSLSFVVLQVAKVATGWGGVPFQTTKHVRDVILCSGNMTGADRQDKGVETMTVASPKNWLSFPVRLANIFRGSTNRTIAEPPIELANTDNRFEELEGLMLEVIEFLSWDWNGDYEKTVWKQSYQTHLYACPSPILVLKTMLQVNTLSAIYIYISNLAVQM